MKDEMANGFCHLNNKACVFTAQDNIFGIKNIHHIFSESHHGWMVTLELGLFGPDKTQNIEIQKHGLYPKSCCSGKYWPTNWPKMISR